MDEFNRDGTGEERKTLPGINLTEAEYHEFYLNVMKKKLVEKTLLLDKIISKWKYDSITKD